MYSSVPPPGIYFPRDLVIKVKYGDSLKRFTASVNGNNLDLDIAKLTEKIILAFNLSPSADIILTYADVDGDTVMLDDDEDLCDAAISQKLNPLRINVQLRAQANAAPVAEPKLNANTAQSLLNDLNRAGSSLEEALKTSPAVLKTLSTVTEDLAKNVPIPILSELLTAVSKLAVSQGVQPANEPSGGSSGSASDAKDTPPAASANATDVFAAAETSKETKFCPDKGATSGLSDTIWCTKEAQDYNNVDKKSAVAKEQSKLISEMQRKGKAAAQNASQKGFLQQQQVVMPPIGPNHQNVFPRGPFGPHPGPPPPMHGRHRSSFSGPSLYPFFMRPPPPPPPPKVPDFPADDAFSSGVNGNMNAPSSNIPPYPVIHPFKKPDGYNSMFSECHVGIACDGCDVSPIVGPRYKSLVKDDYDLCAKCFASFGKADEYTIMDTPAPRMYRDFHAHSKLNLPSPFCPVRGPKMRSKLESRFIKDVTIPDGTIVAPSTPLTKIWRMRNNGFSVWPFGTQLVWVGGDQLSGRFSYQLEIPVNGLPCDEEVDVAVDFCAPAKAGRYLSYWRLASPSGQKFGQRVWVLFQVEHLDNSKKAIKLTINLNQPPESSNRDSTVAEMTQDATEPSVKNTVSNDEHTIDETEIPIIEPETTNVNGVIPSVPPTVSYPLIDLSPNPVVLADASSSAPVLEVPEYKSEDLLLKELEEMGFKQVDLNKEVLRLNKYDLEQSVEDLCGFTEWDPLLDELKEMGFDDKEKNKKLLLKNGGSIKRVVMDLVTGGKAE